MAITGRENPELELCNRSKRIWANISATGAGPRVEGYMFVTDTIGLDIWLQAGVLTVSHP